MLTSSGERDDWNVTMIGREENKQLQPFEFAASMAFFDDKFMSGVVCVEQSVFQQSAVLSRNGYITLFYINKFIELPRKSKTRLIRLMFWPHLKSI
jgi:hypothetical protein